jgi:predicted NAD/FAD-dependent oxidoreductase
MSEVRIAVIGAGMAGRACAHELARADAKVTVYERSRGLGGRLATRRRGQLSFDHGAQFVTARSHPFARYTETALRAGALEAWRPRIMEDDRAWPAPIDDWWVGQPGMSAAVRPLARSVEVLSGIAVHELLPGQRGWELQTDSGRQDRVYRAVAVAVPAPQACTLLGPHGRTFRHLTEVRMAPCWAGMFAFDPPIDAGAEARRWTQGPLTWAACNSSKAGRPAAPQCWVVHASSTWSREHLEMDAAGAALLLLQAFEQCIGRELPAPVYLDAHRWRHAQVEQPLGLSCLVDLESNAGACGDWCIAPRVEAAFESGRSLAHSILSMVGLSTPTLRP